MSNPIQMDKFCHEAHPSDPSEGRTLCMGRTLCIFERLPGRGYVEVFPCRKPNSGMAEVGDRPEDLPAPRFIGRFPEVFSR